MSLFSNQLLLQRLLRKTKEGGSLTADSVSSSTIANGTILTEDLADGIITEAKFHPDVQTILANFAQDLNNLKFPGWYGTFTIKNNNASNPNTITFTVEEHYYNPITDTIEVRLLLASTTLAHNQQETITSGIHERLTSDESIIKISYTLSAGSIVSTDEVGVNIENADGSVFDLSVQSAFRHNGNIEFEVTIE